jgi:hypothetical protein
MKKNEKKNEFIRKNYMVKMKKLILNRSLVCKLLL